MHSTSHRLLLAFSYLPVIVTIKNAIKYLPGSSGEDLWWSIYKWRDNKTMVPMLVYDVDEWAWI